MRNHHNFTISAFLYLEQRVYGLLVRYIISYSRKKLKAWRLRMYLFEKKDPEIFRFVTLPIKIPDRTMFHTHLEIPQNFVWHHLQFQGQKPRSMEIPHEFFSITPRNSTSFLIDPWNFHILFFKHSWKFHVFNPHVWVFSGIAQLARPKKLF